jgi:hypothetical protein
MTSKAAFNAEEWATVTAGPPLAGLIVIAAERGGTLRESMEMGRAYKEARQRQPEAQLLDELLTSPPALESGEFKTPEELRERGIAQLREAVALVDEKADAAEAAAYRAFVMELAERAAHAHKTGGFLGFGGHEVSDNERAALDEIGAAIGAEPTAPGGEPATAA